MSRPYAWTWTVLAALLPASVTADPAGEKCDPSDPPPRQGLICKPAFVEIDGSPEPEYEFDPPQILNAQRGDSILTADCTLIRGLLRQVQPPQDYSHSGIMVEDRYRIRHSTAAEARYEEEAFLIGWSAPGSDGIRKDVLRYGWPGTMTQYVGEAFEGEWLSSPETGTAYKVKAFNNEPRECLSNLAPSVVLTMPDELDVPSDPQYLRPKLWDAATEAEAIQGHYRFWAYSDAAGAYASLASIGPGEPSHWADGTRGTVCTSFILEALAAAGYDAVEGDAVEDDDLGAEIGCDPADGLYCYTVGERQDAGAWLYQRFYDLVDEKATDSQINLTDAADDLANQVCNCFAYDWCGTEVPPEECGIPGPQTEYDAKDSECWQEPGIGEAVSPDDMLFWDTAPDGPYGKKHDVVLQPGRWIRVYRWAAASGTASVRGTVFGAGTPDPVEGAVVEIEGGSNVGLTSAFTEADGAFEFIGVPAGSPQAPLDWGLQACKDDLVGKYEIVEDLVEGDDVEEDLVLNDSCDPDISVSDWHRAVHISGNLRILDDETPPAAVDEHGNFTIDELVLVSPDAPSQTVAISKCAGDEVRAKIQLIVELNVYDRSVDVVADVELWEGSSCSDNEVEGSGSAHVEVPPDNFGPFDLDLTVVSDEWDSCDEVELSLNVDNFKAQP